MMPRTNQINDTDTGGILDQGPVLGYVNRFHPSGPLGSPEWPLGSPEWPPGLPPAARHLRTLCYRLPALSESACLAPLAQLAEQLTLNQRVRGSSP